MGQFDPSKYDLGGDSEKSIVTAREDLEKDYPGARVFISYLDGDKPDVAKEVRLAPPDGQSEVVRGRFEVPRTGILSGFSWGYQYTVFSEGKLQYQGKIDAGGGWATWSDDAHVTIEHGESDMRTFTWMRQDGTTHFRMATDIDLENWMGQLADDLLLSQLTIPGTHNSHAIVGTPVPPVGPSMGRIAGPGTAAECQGWTITQQLTYGVRSLDLRYGDNLNMRHGQVVLPGNLADCIKEVTDFLSTHPTETVVVSAKWDKWSFPKNDYFPEDPATRAKVTSLFATSPSFLDVSTVPTLGQCRGKFIRKLAGAGNTQGLDFARFPIPSSLVRPKVSLPPFKSDGLTRQQSRWAWCKWKLENSWLQSKSDLDWNLDVGQRPSTGQAPIIMKVDLNDYYKDTDSVLSFSNILPIDFAREKNLELHKWVTKNCSLDKAYPLGFVTLDFADHPGPELLKKLVLTNFT